MIHSTEQAKITFIGIDGVGTDVNILKALKFTKNYIPNATYKFLTSGDYDSVDGIDILKIRPLNYENFSKFCLTEMNDYIKTDYMINCQADGFVINPSKWDSHFLNYDYIGAPWPNHTLENSSIRWKLVGKHYKKGQYNIGNGGFSLRSKKLLLEVSKLYSDEFYGINEDLVICVILREKLEKMGIKFPENVEIAAKFSCETEIVDEYIFSTSDSFGFHSKVLHPDKVKLLEKIIL